MSISDPKLACPMLKQAQRWLSLLTVTGMFLCYMPVTTNRRKSQRAVSSLSNTMLTCTIHVPKLPPPLPYSFNGHFWSSGAESSVGLQELAATRVKPLQVKEETTSTGRRKSIHRGRRQQRPVEALCSLSSGSVDDYSRAPSHTKINKQFLRSPGNFATLNKSLQSYLRLHFTLTSSLTVPSFQDQLEARAKRIKNKAKQNNNREKTWKARSN